MGAADVSRDVDFFTPSSVDPLFAKAFALGESQSRFLGMLTPEAWREYADKQTILVAVASPDVAVDTKPELLGYAAFRLPRDEVVLAHLVVNHRHAVAGHRAPTGRGAVSGGSAAVAESRRTAVATTRQTRCGHISAS